MAEYIRFSLNPQGVCADGAVVGGRASTGRGSWRPRSAPRRSEPNPTMQNLAMNPPEIKECLYSSGTRERNHSFPSSSPAKRVGSAGAPEAVLLFVGVAGEDLAGAAGDGQGLRLDLDDSEMDRAYGDGKLL